MARLAGEVADLVTALQLEPAGENRFTAFSAEGVGEGDVVFGGQMAAQMTMAAGSIDDTKTVQSIQVLFVRAALRSLPVELHVETLQRGRTFASAMVTAFQNDKLCSRSLALLTAQEPDLIRHSERAPSVEGPEQSRPEPLAGGLERRVVGGVDHSDPDAVGPASIVMWARLPGAPKDARINQAIVAFMTAGLLIGTAMRPHAGVGTSLAHESVSTGIMTHQVHFHEPVAVDEWILVEHASPFAGNGRTFGVGRVYSPDGNLAASFGQDNMVRHFPTDSPSRAGRTIL